MVGLATPASAATPSTVRPWDPPPSGSRRGGSKNARAGPRPPGRPRAGGWHRRSLGRPPCSEAGRAHAWHPSPWRDSTRGETVAGGVVARAHAGQWAAVPSSPTSSATVHAVRLALDGDVAASKGALLV